MIGQTIGHYRIDEKLGEGGMGVVYRAEDMRLGRTVALKILPPERVASPERLARFLQEARLASALNHPNIATILDVGEAGGHYYIAMEFVEGESLRRRLSQQVLKLPELLELAMQIADALAEAHGRGIIHRDIKSENIMVTPKGRAKMLDFGLGKRLPGSEAKPGDLTQSAAGALTEMGMVMGTVQWMSPEQALGQPVDARSDLFSFGVVLYEMAAGRLPFEGQSVTSTIDKILHQPPRSPSLVNTELPAPVEELILKLLEKNPEDRYQSAREVLVDLRRLKRALDTGTLATARVTGGRGGAPAQISRKQKILLATALVAAAALGLLVGGRYLPRPARPAMHFSVVTNFAGVEAQPSLSPDGRSVAFVSNRDGPFDIWIGLVTGGSLVRVTRDPNFKVRPRWSPDGSKIAYARLDEAGLWDIWVVPALGGTPRQILANAVDPAWSPDGRSLAYANDATKSIWIADATGANPRALTSGEPGGFHRQPAFSHDGSRVAFARRGMGPYAELSVASVSTGKIEYLTGDKAFVLSPVWSPDDRSIYFSSSRGGTMNIWRVPSDGGAPEQITAGQGDDAELDLSADGKRIVFSSYRINVNLAEVSLDAQSSSTGPKWLTTDSARGELAPTYSPDGRHIAYFSNRKGAENEGVWVMDSDGSNPIQLVDDDRINVFPRWSGDGQTLAYTSRQRGPLPGVNEMRRVALSGARLETFPVEVGDVMSGDIAPDGRLVFLSPDGVPRVFDPRNNQTQKLEPVRGRILRWSPDGQAVAYIVYARRQGDDQAGLWVYNFKEAPRQLFRGWAVWYAWAGPNEIFFLEGKPDLKASLWRVRLDGSPPVRTPTSLHVNQTYLEQTPQLRFDVHPDRRRLATEVLEVFESDIGMIENIR